MKSHTAFPLAYLHLTLTHSKIQGQGRAHFDCENLAAHTGSRMWHFDRLWLILKIKVKSFTFLLRIF